MTIPHRHTIRKGYAINFVRGSRIIVMRIIPYPPSFKRMAARIIDPAMGASTWAFGNHR